MKIKQRESLKLHYGKYLYKVCLTNQLSNLFSSHRTEQYRAMSLNDLKTDYENGTALQLTRWRSCTIIDNEDFKDALVLHQVFQKYPDYRKRVDFGNSITIYTSDDDMLDELVDNLSNSINEVHKPKEVIEAFLTQNIGTAIVKTLPEHEFRVYLKGNRIDPSFANWLRANRDKCKVGEMTLWNIENSSYHTNNNYFYIKNEKVLTMVRMIIGHNIRKVERLIYQGDIDKYTHADKK